MNRKKVQNGLLWIVPALLILCAVVAGFIHPSTRALFFGETKVQVAMPESKESSGFMESVGLQDAEDTTPLIEAKLRQEYEARLKSELAKELAKATSNDQENKETLSPAVIFEKPRGVVTDITKLGSGIPLRTEVVYGTGDTAMVESQLDDSYTATYQLKMRIPRAAISISEIEKATPELSKILPGFAGLFPLGAISPWHDTVYRNKLSEIRSNSSQLSTLLTKPNAYDCNTILHLRSEKGRKVFFMQADMDAVIKGSDGDRAPVMPPSQVDSIDYDPFTAYQWRKTGKSPNPMIAGWERRIAIGMKELDDPGLNPERKVWVEERIAMLKTAIEAMKKRSYLISAHDPYIVLPIGILKDTKDPYAPKVGDYACVILGRRIYPCIVGDAGSDTKVGEASARMALALVPRWDPTKKPVSYPGVCYLVFPGSRENDTAVPDHTKWREKCLALLREIGGVGNGIEFHDWTIPAPAPAEGKPETPAKKGESASPPKPADTPESQN